LLQEEPRWLAEAVLLTRAATAVSAHLAGSAQSAGGREAFAYSSAMLEHHDSSSPTAAAHIGKVAAVVERIAGGWPQNRPLRVLELGVASGGLSRALVPILARHDGCLVAADTDKARVDRLRILFDNDISFEARHLDGSPDGLACAGPFDL